MGTAPSTTGPRLAVTRMKFEPTMLRAYLVGGSQDTHHAPAELLTKTEEALQAGITAFQYREKGSSNLSADQRLKLAQQLRELTRHYRVPFFIDDDEELALAVGADGVHVGQKDQRIEQVIQRAQGKLMIGYSCNRPAQIEKANQLAAVDYIGSGPVFPTQSKADADPALGLSRLALLNCLSEQPVVAIGGITADNIAATLATGVAGAAVISMVFQSDDISQTVHQMLTASSQS